MKVIIKTTKDNNEVTYEYNYDGDLNIPVTTLLERINHSHEKKIHYSSSCLQGICGSCAMQINGWPKLACKTFVNEEAMTKHFNKITIEPLSKFPVIKDLKVDRTQIHENMKKAQQWLESNAKIKKENINLEYELSQCLMCGCCLEACPNYNGENDYYGVILPVTSAKLKNQEENKEQKEELLNNYEKHFYKNCVKSLVCEDVCPVNIPTQRAISHMNYNSLKNFFHIFKK